MKFIISIFVLVIVAADDVAKMPMDTAGSKPSGGEVPTGEANTDLTDLNKDTNTTEYQTGRPPKPKEESSEDYDETYIDLPDINDFIPKVSSGSKKSDDYSDEDPVETISISLDPDEEYPTDYTTVYPTETLTETPTKGSSRETIISESVEDTTEKPTVKPTKKPVDKKSPKKPTKKPNRERPQKPNRKERTIQNFLREYYGTSK